MESERGSVLIEHHLFEEPASTSSDDARSARNGERGGGLGARRRLTCRARCRHGGAPSGGEAKGRGDLFVGAAHGDQRHRLALALGEAGGAGERVELGGGARHVEQQAARRRRARGLAGREIDRRRTRSSPPCRDSQNGPWIGTTSPSRTPHSRASLTVPRSKPEDGSAPSSRKVKGRWRDIEAATTGSP